MDDEKDIGHEVLGSILAGQDRPPHRLTRQPPIPSLSDFGAYLIASRGRR
jgi:hypothetical protein